MGFNSQTRDGTGASASRGRSLSHWTTWEVPGSLSLFLNSLAYLCWLFELRWGFVAAAQVFLQVWRGESGPPSSQCPGLSLRQPHPRRSTGASALALQQLRLPVLDHRLELRLTGPAASWHVGSSGTRDPTPCPLHWQADSPPLSHQGSRQ